MDQVTVCFTSKSPFGARETELPARHTKTQVRPDNARTLPCAHSRSASGLSPLSSSAADISRGISFSRIVKVRRTVSLQRCASKQVSSEFKRSATMIAMPRNFRVTDTVMTPSALFCCFYPSFYCLDCAASMHFGKRTALLFGILGNHSPSVSDGPPYT